MNMVQRFPPHPAGDHKFNWLDDRDDVVVGEQAAIAIYQNPNGDIVIRQKASSGEDNDSIVVVTPRDAGILAMAIMNAAAERQRHHG
jgi:hypothetical protein